MCDNISHVRRFGPRLLATFNKERGTASDQLTEKQYGGASFYRNMVRIRVCMLQVDTPIISAVWPANATTSSEERAHVMAARTESSRLRHPRGHWWGTLSTVLRGGEATHQWVVEQILGRKGIPDFTYQVYTAAAAKVTTLNALGCTVTLTRAVLWCDGAMVRWCDGAMVRWCNCRFWWGSCVEPR